jgi:hypothetical protein
MKTHLRISALVLFISLFSFVQAASLSNEKLKASAEASANALKAMPNQKLNAQRAGLRARQGMGPMGADKLQKPNADNKQLQSAEKLKGGALYPYYDYYYYPYYDYSYYPYYDYAYYPYYDYSYYPYYDYYYPYYDYGYGYKK